MSRKTPKDLSASLLAIDAQLTSVTTTVAAAKLMAALADEFIGWDACSLDFYVAERNTIWPVFAMDVIEGQKVSVPAVYANTTPSATGQRVLTEGGQLILREPTAPPPVELIPFGDKNRPSKSLMFVPIRDGAKILGIFSIQSYEMNAYTREDLGILQKTADHCGESLNRIRGQEALARLAAIVETCTDAILSINRDGVITSWNGGAEKIFGYLASEAQGHELTLVLPASVPQNEATFLRQIEQGGEAATWETWRMRKDGRTIEVRITASPLKDSAGHVIGTSQIIHDITERKRAERQVHALSRLGQALGAATSPLDVARIIAAMAEDLFSWDALELENYFPQEDRMQLVLNIDTINGKKKDLATGGARTVPTNVTRRVMALGSELVLRKPPIKMPVDDVPFGDTARPSVSIMRTAIQHRGETVGFLALHSYQLNAYTEADLMALRAFAEYSADTLARIAVEEKMAALNGELLNTARRAGMEEVANSVLHNVGNVLNSVNVSATVVREAVQNSKLDGLNRVKKMLETQGGNLGQFMTEDAQGKKLGDYLAALGEYWTAEKSKILQEMAALGKNIDHIKNIISRQQAFAGNSAFAETVFISDLLEEALDFSGPDFAGQGIKITREYTMHYPLMLDKMKIMLILVNLLANAREALLASSQPTRQLRLRTETRANERLQITVEDNGAGISPEHLEKIFTQGFTTKKTGHGFGLHSSLLAARELGGKLSATSSGIHQGAVFRLELPLTTAQKNIPVPAAIQENARP